MGLDVYVGSLTRYYCGDWETLVQRWARETGHTVQVVRPPSDADAEPIDPLEARELVLAWRDALSTALQAHGGPALAWDEGPDAPYFTDKPAWDCYRALVVWAAHDEHPGVALPAIAPDDCAATEPVRAALEHGTRYPQLVLGAELWLPQEFDYTFETQDAAGRSVMMGSAPLLLAQLRELNERTWRADRDTVTAWRRAGAEVGAPLETSAQLAYAVFHDLALQATVHQLPMKLDY
jgi:hypothetical protein